MDAMSSLPRAERKVEISTARNGACAEMSISDTGPGIPPDELNNIFTPFFSTKADRMGMGLSIASTIVDAHDGQITAQNQGQGGAVLEIKLPICVRGGL